MKTLLMLNGKEGIQTGIEDGFNFLLEKGLIKDLRWFYFQEYFTKNGCPDTLEKISEICNKFQPQLIVFFHISKFPISKKFLHTLRLLPTNPLIVYDEGDMYGTWAKPATASMRTIMKFCDMVSIRGLGKFYREVSKLNRNVFYTPHHADIARFDRKPYILENRTNTIVLVGNRVKPRLLSGIRRLPGAYKREKFVEKMGESFPDIFALYGNGWDGFVGNRGPVLFHKQIDIYRDSWITVAYEHYPEIPYYFSNRLPIALMAGSLYVCHHHVGYEEMFKGCNFIFFFKSNLEAVDQINFLLSLSKEELIKRSIQAREFSIKHFHPNVVWENFYNNILDKSSERVV